nr:hypothetical protein [Allomuricauda sp.]
MGTDKDLEKLVDNLMGEAPLETAPSNFTHLVMQEVTKLEQQKIVYKPLISMKTLLMVLGVLAVGVVLLTFMSEPAPTALPYHETISELGNWFSNKLSQIQFSKTMAYMVVAIGTMMIFQTVVLKRYFNNRLV